MYKNLFHKKQKGFSLAELLTIVMLISILTTMLLPYFRKAFESAKLSDCINNEKEFATMIQTYYVEWKQFPLPDPNGSIPTEGLLPYTKLTPDYTSAANKTSCPQSHFAYLYDVNDTNDNFTITCTAGHSVLGVPLMHPQWVFASGLDTGK
jgi:type II secretory pathway pseudopilin PulG